MLDAIGTDEDAEEPEIRRERVGPCDARARTREVEPGDQEEPRELGVFLEAGQ